jgi:hypothetical protein
MLETDNNDKTDNKTDVFFKENAKKKNPDYCSVNKQFYVIEMQQLANSLNRYITDKKENENFLMHKEIQMRSVTKSYMRKGFLYYMRKWANI